MYFIFKNAFKLPSNFFLTLTLVCFSFKKKKKKKKKKKRGGKNRKSVLCDQNGSINKYVQQSEYIYRLMQK